MATLKDLENYLERLPGQLLDDCTDIIEETAVQHYKASFTRKGFDGKQWETTEKNSGSTMVESGNLMNSITSRRIKRGHVRVSAGNSKVRYAQIHQEGSKATVNVSPFTRRGRAVRAHTRKMNTPARPYMGDSSAMRATITKRIKQHLNTIKKL